MNVRGAGFHRFGKDGIDQTDDWSIVFLLQQILGFRYRVRQGGQIHIVADALHHLHGFGGIVLVGGVQGLIESIRVNGGETGPAATDSVRFRKG